jgi:N-acetylneuraminic acid mutarotase
MSSVISSHKDLLAVGTELLVFAIDNCWQSILMRYSILTNSWIQMSYPMNYHIYQFGSTSVGQKAYLAGGAIDYPVGEILSNAAAMYDSEENVWEPLPSMNTARKLCAAAFMDGKLYVIGGVGCNREVLTCGEEYDFERGSWRVIDNMAEGLMTNTHAAAPLVAVVNNELYAADYSELNVNRYDKQNNRWITLGKLPGHMVSIYNNGRGFGFKACGDKLIAIGTSWCSTHVELYSWVPSEQPTVWNLIARHPSGTYLYNSTVMSC